MIFNAKDLPLSANPGTLPNMSGTLTDWFQKITFTVITKQNIGFRIIETEEESEFMGVIQPLSAEKLQIKPEGQRSWKWWVCHALPSLVLSTDDIIVIRGQRFRVMGKSGFQDYGFCRYELVEDYMSTTGGAV